MVVGGEAIVHIQCDGSGVSNYNVSNMLICVHGLEVSPCPAGLLSAIEE